MLNVIQEGIHQLRQIMGRNVAGHSNGNTGGTVGQQIRHPCWQDNWLFLGIVIVRLKIDGVLVQVDHQVLGHPFHPNFGITHGGG